MSNIDDHVADTALALLAAGPLADTKRGAEYEALLERTFGRGKSLRKKKTSCAVFVGAVKIEAGFPKRGWPAANGICTWAGTSWFAKRDWIPVEKLESGEETTQRGDCPYWSGSPTDHVKEDDLNGHIGIIVERGAEWWQCRTAEGGGGDGTECRLSAGIKDIRWSGKRPLRGVWRPSRSKDAPVAPGSPHVAPAPVSATNPPAERPTLRKGSQGAYVRMLQAAIGAVVDGAFGPRTEAALKAFQKRVGITQDGVAGPKTWTAIDRQETPPDAA